MQEPYMDIRYQTMDMVTEAILKLGIGVYTHMQITLAFREGSQEQSME
jgi:hypothetical protein